MQNVMQIIHNPGSVAPSEFTDLADLTVVIEDTMQVFRSRLDQGIFNAELLNDRGRESRAVMIHSIAADLDFSQRLDLVNSVKTIAANVFFTDIQTEYYQKFSAQWLDWVAAVASD